MKLSELGLSEICDYCRIIEEDLTDIEKTTLEAMKRAAIEYCVNYTGLSYTELEPHEDITIAVLCLIGDMYDNRQRYVDKSNVNRTTETILGLYNFNLIPEEHDGY